jgi:hypothetical protein
VVTWPAAAVSLEVHSLGGRRDRSQQGLSPFDEIGQRPFIKFAKEGVCRL